MVQELNVDKLPRSRSDVIGKDGCCLGLLAQGIYSRFPHSLKTVPELILCRRSSTYLGFCDLPSGSILAFQMVL